ncbi:MAG: histone deacetylase family protein [Candidatus Hodarchaeales archaeon]
MNSVRFISNTLAKKHSNGRFHPESPQRIEMIENWVSSQLGDDISFEISDKLASKDDILSVHTEDHHDLIEKTKNYDGHFYFDGDTAANSYSYEAAMQAVQIGIQAVFESTRNSSIFCLVRPPGHHATQHTPQGFCIFNNIAVGSQIALNKKKYQRIAILDFDHHFGNGTAYINESNPNILYISTHADPRISYPGCGFSDEIGFGEGRGFNIPIPLGYRASEADLEISFDSIINPIIYQFKPDFLAISAGFDAYERDPIGVLGVTVDGFRHIGKMIKKITDNLNIPYAHFLEGGYNINLLPELVSAYIDPFIGKEDFKEKINPSLQIKEETKTTIQNSKRVLKDYWSL